MNTVPITNLMMNAAVMDSDVSTGEPSLLMWSLMLISFVFCIGLVIYMLWDLYK